MSADEFPADVPHYDLIGVSPLSTFPPRLLQRFLINDPLVYGGKLKAGRRYVKLAGPHRMNACPFYVPPEET